MAPKTAPPQEPPKPTTADDRAASDLVLVVGGKKDGSELQILRSRAGELEAGVMRTVQDGKPLHGELVELRQRSEHPMLFDARSVELPPTATAGRAPASPASPQAPRAAAPLRKGPAQVATDTYRTNWDRIFSSPGGNKLAN